MKTYIAVFIFSLFLFGCSSEPEEKSTGNNELSAYENGLDFYFDLRDILEQGEYESTDEYNSRVSSALNALGKYTVEEKLSTTYDADAQVLEVSIPQYISVYENGNLLGKRVEFRPYDYKLNEGFVYYNAWDSNDAYLDMNATEAQKLDNDFYLQAEFYFTLDSTTAGYTSSISTYTCYDKCYRITGTAYSYKLYNKVNGESYVW